VRFCNGLTKLKIIRRVNEIMCDIIMKCIEFYSLCILFKFNILKVLKILIDKLFGKKKFFHEDMKPANCLVN